MSKISPSEVKHIWSDSYFKGSLQSNGFLLQKADNERILNLTTTLEHQIEELEIFNHKNKERHISEDVFDGDEKSKIHQPGRYIMHYDTFCSSPKFTVFEKNRFDRDVILLKNECVDELIKLVPTIKKDCIYSFNVLKSVFAKLRGSQVVHVDDDYENLLNTDTYICFVASSKCQICVMKGSHLYQTYSDFLTDKVTFSVPVVCNMKKGERLFMHIKLFHCGWECESDNFRYFFMLNLHHVNTRVHILNPVVCAAYDGTKKRDHYKNIRNSDALKKKKEKMTSNMEWRMLPSIEKKRRLQECSATEIEDTENFVEKNIVFEKELVLFQSDDEECTNDDSDDEDYIPCKSK